MREREEGVEKRQREGKEEREGEEERSESDDKEGMRVSGRGDKEEEGCGGQIGREKR